MDWTDEQVEVLRWVFNAAGIDLDNLVEAIKKICEAMVICCTEFEEAMTRVANMVRAGATDAARELEELAAALEENRGRMDLPNAREQRKARARQRAVEQAAASRFRQYKARESAWTARKRTGQRRREWRGPWKDKR